MSAFIKLCLTVAMVFGVAGFAAAQVLAPDRDGPVVGTPVNLAPAAADATYEPSAAPTGGTQGVDSTGPEQAPAVRREQREAREQRREAREDRREERLDRDDDEVKLVTPEPEDIDDGDGADDGADDSGDNTEDDDDLDDGDDDGEHGDD
jgi:hypothetical protein